MGEPKDAYGEKAGNLGAPKHEKTDNTVSTLYPDIEYVNRTLP
jgi:hypothetical protein